MVARGAAEMALAHPAAPEAHIFRVVAVACQQAASELEKAELQEEQQPEENADESSPNP